MILAFAGNRVDAAGRTPPRLPASNARWLGQRLERLLAALRPAAVVGAAAAGADLLILEAALHLQIPIHAVLPLPPATFRDVSVADRGPGWARRFDRLIESLPPGSLSWTDASPQDERVFEHGNRRILEAAASLAAGDVVLALAVRPKPDSAPDSRASDSRRPDSRRPDAAPAPEPSMTDDFAARAGAQGLLVLELDPRLRRADMRTAFVVMPYGVKTDRGGNQIDCEATFAKVVVPALESADLDWTRADRETDAGIIHVGMLDRLARSDTVIVDTATENANAFYELGARHVLRAGTTVLIGPEGTRPPFNVNMLRRVGYRITDSRVSDDDAVAAVRRLLPFLAPSGPGPAKADSPLYQLFDIVPPQLTAAHETDSPPVRLHRQIDEATTVEQLIALADAVDGTDLARTQRAELILRLGARLRESEAYAEAVRLLEALEVPSEQTLLYGWWCQQLALAERRLGEQLLAEGADPGPLWDRAERRLLTAVRLLGDDPETCGIAGGLAKRRALRVLRTDTTATGRLRAGALLDRAIGFYRRGFATQPAVFYNGVNLLTLGRLRAAQGAAPSGLDLATVATVTGFYAERGGSDDFWAAATTAELRLGEHLADPDTVPLEAVLAAYCAALAVPHPEEYVGPVRDQLDLVRRASGAAGGAAEAVLALPDFAEHSGV